MLAGLFGGSVARLLEVLVFASEPLHLRETARRAQMAPIQASRALSGLVKAGLVERKPVGNMVLFSLNRESREAKLLSELVESECGVIPALKKALEKEENVETAFVYGSFASRKQGAKSDVDVIVVGSADLVSLARAFSEASVKYGREINYSVYSRKEFDAKKKTPFLKRVLAEEKIMLVGKL